MGGEPRELPSAEVLNAIFRYDDVHGHLYRRKGVKALNRADTEKQSGYFYVRLTFEGEKRYLTAHRVIWKMAYGYDPYPEIDHIDRDPGNNRFFNLREVSSKENARNRSLGDDSMPLGVYSNNRGRFRAQIMVNRKAFYLGTFDTIQDASMAVSSALSLTTI